MSSGHPLPPTLPGFNHVRRHWSDKHNMPIAIIEPGQFYVSKNNEAISTTLGSCISVCIRDPAAGIAGMNHFMLPNRGNIYEKEAEQVSNAARYGNWAMEYLINEILKNGGKRRNFEIKLFGGACAPNNQLVCGENIGFVQQYLYDEDLKVASKDVGGNLPRKILYLVSTGKVLMKKIEDRQEDVLKIEMKYMDSIQKDNSATSGSIDLF